MSAILVKSIDDGKTIFRLVADNLPENYTLSQQNCLEIEQHYNFGLPNIASIIAKNKFPDNPEMKISKRYENGFKQMAFIDGINFCLTQLLSDRRFTKEDVLNAYIKGIKEGELKNDPAFSIHDFAKDEQAFRDSLDSEEFNVEIVTECPQCKEWGYISDCRKNCNKRFIQPKLDEQGNLILKPV